MFLDLKTWVASNFLCHKSALLRLIVACETTPAIDYRRKAA
jgi:hypothetical protein